jgi:hypothetical protein
VHSERIASMKFLKTQNLSKFSISDKTLIVRYPSGRASFNSEDSLRLPKGAINKRPVIEEEAQIRFTTNDTGDHEITDTADYFPSRAVGLEVYFEGQWFPLRLQGPAKVIKDDLGVGNWDAITQTNQDISKWFPISGEPLTYVPGLAQGFDPLDYVDNMMVLVENVIQISGTNFDLEESDGIVVGVQVNSGGTGLTPSTPVAVTFTTPTGGVAATGTATVDGGGVVTYISVDTPGSLYDGSESYTVTVPGATGGSYTVKIAKPGWHIKFLSAVPNTKPVTVYTGYDQ